MIGRTIAHYTILEKLGEGGMGVVYKARDLVLDRVVALKLLPRNAAATPEESARFMQEARAAAVINHPNVCTIYRIDEHEGQKFIEMEYVDGTTLRKLHPAPDVRTIARYALQIAEALRAAHQHGVVHRDIKSENIMVNAAGQVKVMDFGLAKLPGSENLTRSSSTVGTVAYMSPEQIRGERLDHRTDQFSFGVVLFEMLAGRLPFRGEHEAAMMYSIVNEEPSSLEAFRPDVPPALSRIVGRLLSKDASARYARPDDLVAELTAAQTSESGSVRPPSGSSPAQASPVGRGRRLTMLAAAAVFVLVVAAAVWYLGRAPETARSYDSIAVLPFENVGGDPNAEYLSDGISEHVINALARLGKLRVTPRSTSFYYKKREADPQAIGNELGVRTVLTGRVIQREGNLNIQIELIDVKERSQVWGEQYSRPSGELLSLQEELERSVALHLGLAGADISSISRRTTENTEAYQLYLRGRYYWDKRSVAGFAKASQYFQQALDIDPNYALAQIGMADCYDLLGLGLYNGMPSAEALPKAKAAIARAFELDSTRGEAYTTRAHMNHSFEWDWPRAEADFKRALDLSPRYGTLHVFYGAYLNAVGRTAEAKQHFETAQSLEPLSLPINAWLAMEYYYERQYDKSIEQFRKTMDIDDSFGNAHYLLAFTQLEMGRTKDAVKEMAIARAVTADNPTMRAGYVLALARDGRKEAARRSFDSLLVVARERYVSPHNMAIAYIAMGDTANFYRALEQAVDEKAFNITVSVLRVDPFFDFAKSDPRYRTIFAKTGLPPY